MEKTETNQPVNYSGEATSLPPKDASSLSADSQPKKKYSFIVKIVKVILIILYIPLISYFLTKLSFVHEIFTFPAMIFVAPLAADAEGLGAGFVLIFYYIIFVLAIGILSLFVIAAERKIKWFFISLLIVLMPIVYPYIPGEYEIQSKKADEKFVQNTSDLTATFSNISYYSKKDTYTNEDVTVAKTEITFTGLPKSGEGYGLLVSYRNNEEFFGTSYIQLNIEGTKIVASSHMSDDLVEYKDTTVIAHKELQTDSVTGSKTVDEIEIMFIEDIDFWTIRTGSRNTTLRLHETKKLEPHVESLLERVL